MSGGTLTENFTVDEIETVLAHELGHHVHQDLIKGFLLQSVLTLVSVRLADQVMHWGMAESFGVEN